MEREWNYILEQVNLHNLKGLLTVVLFFKGTDNRILLFKGFANRIIML